MSYDRFPEVFLKKFRDASLYPDKWITVQSGLCCQAAVELSKRLKNFRDAIREHGCPEGEVTSLTVSGKFEIRRFPALYGLFDVKVKTRL